MPIVQIENSVLEKYMPGSLKCAETAANPFYSSIRFLPKIKTLYFSEFELHNIIQYSI